MYSDDELVGGEASPSQFSSGVGSFSSGDGERWSAFIRLDPERSKQCQPVADFVLALRPTRQRVTEEMSTAARVIPDPAAHAAKIGNDVAAYIAPRVKRDVEVSL